MTRADTGRTSERAGRQLRGAGRFGAGTASGWAAVVAGIVPFLLLWVLIRDTSSALVRADLAIATGLNDLVRDEPAVVDALRVVTELAGTWTAVLVFAVTVVFLAVQRSWRLALFVVVVAIGLWLLVPVTKALIGRARPLVEVPVAETPVNASFPSGHSMTAIVLWGTVVLVALPAVRRAARPWLLLATVLLVMTIGFTRLALGVHFLSDVLAGWALGLAWLAAAALAFRAWPGRTGTHDLDPLGQGGDDVVDVDDPRRALDGLGLEQVAVPLVATATALTGVLVGLGLLVAGPWSDTWLGRWERQAVAAVVDLRSGALNTVVSAVSTLSDTTTVLALGAAIGLLSLGATGRWRPMLYVATAIAGEALLYFVVSRIVGRERPEVADLTTGLPAASSWPSGHAAAAVVLYGALAVVLVTGWSSPLRWISVALPVVIPLVVAVSRVYLGAHYPTDVLAGLVLGAVWLLACSRWLPPWSSGAPDGARELDAATRGGARAPDGRRSTTT